MRSLLYLLTLLILTLASILVFVPQPNPVRALPPRQGPEISQAKTWGYQLQGIDPRLVPHSLDMIVIDYSRDGTQARALTAREIDALRRRPDGSMRIVLCYLSVGEAEKYRYYWQPGWGWQAPSWLGAENPSWKGNYSVQYWQAGWQKIFLGAAPEKSSLFDRWVAKLFSSSRPFLDQIVEAGFDGVYLDRVDAYDKAAETRPTAKADMIAFVKSIASYARSRRAGFLIVPQNGEALLENKGYRQVIDAIGKEDLLFGAKGDGVANPVEDVRYDVAILNRAKADGRPVFVVEYLVDPAVRRASAATLQQHGFIGAFAERTLSQPPSAPEVLAVPAANN